MSDPAGPAAEWIGDLTGWMTALGTVVFVVFCLALAYAVLHRRRPDATPTPERERRAGRAVVLLGAVVPAVILIALFLWTIRTLAALDPRSRTPDLVVDVVGKQWWWELRYRDSVPAKEFMAANELVVPVGRRVELRLRSTDVNHSFWVPALQGKTDQIPGRENVTWIEAARPGVYGGACAEYCGTQHTKMKLLVIALPVPEYERWAAAQRLPAAEPRDSVDRLAQETFLGSACALCHAVRGTPALGGAGPDLTHLASRRTLAAGALPNTPGHLAGWIANPQALKPGSRMPRVPLDTDELRRIHHYMLTLK